METLQSRIDKVYLEQDYVRSTLEKMKKVKALYIFGIGDRAKYLSDFLKSVGIEIRGFLVNEVYLTNTIDMYVDNVSSFERKLEGEEEFSIVLGISSSLLDMEMFKCAKVKNVFLLNIGIRDDYLLNREIYEQHISRLNWLYEAVEDDYSREVLYTNIIGRLTGKDMQFPPSKWGDPQYFLRDLIQWHENECLMDGGAFTGDTVEEFIGKMGEDVLNYKIYAWEPDPVNFHILSQKYVNNSHVIPLCKGMASHSAILKFSSSKGNKETSCVTENGDLEIEVSSIDEVAGLEKVTFIKMDIEGSEFDALKGARKQITENTPQIAVCLYHKQEDMWTIPQYILSLNKAYKLYLRTHSSMPTELVLFCVPKAL